MPILCVFLPITLRHIFKTKRENDVCILNTTIAVIVQYLWSNCLSCILKPPNMFAGAEFNEHHPRGVHTSYYGISPQNRCAFVFPMKTGGVWRSVALLDGGAQLQGHVHNWSAACLTEFGGGSTIWGHTSHLCSSPWSCWATDSSTVGMAAMGLGCTEENTNGHKTLEILLAPVALNLHTCKSRPKNALISVTGSQLRPPGGNFFLQKFRIFDSGVNWIDIDNWDKFENTRGGWVGLAKILTP